MKLPERLSHFLSSQPGLDLSGSGEHTDVVMPWTGHVLASFRANVARDVEDAIERARIAQHAWAQVPVAERARIIGGIHHHVKKNEELLLDVIQAENGKSRIHAYDEVMDAYNVIRFVSRNAVSALADRAVRGAIPGLTRTRVVHDPVGVVGFISPWNFPLSLGANDLLASLVAGNAVVHKPDSKTPLSTVLLRRFAIAAGVPADVWQLVPGPVDEVSAPLTDGVDGLSFTGSTKAGKQISQAVAHRLIPTALELGGKNPMIVLPDASLDRAAEVAVRGCFASTGQLCLSIERIYVVDDSADQHRTRAFIDRFVEATQRQRVGAGFDYAAGIGSLTHQQQLERVTAHLTDAVDKGAQIETGGHPLPDVGPLFFSPTILSNVPETAELFRTETFGPVVSVYSARSTDEAIELANDTDYGLNASVITGDSERGWDVARRVEAGMVNINEAYAAVWGSIAAPSGGVKDSGLGHRHGTEGLTIFTRSRTLAHQRVMPLAPFSVHVPVAGTIDITAHKFQRIMSFSLDAMRALRMK